MLIIATRRELVDQPGLECGIGQIAIAAGQEPDRIGKRAVDRRLGPGRLHIVLPMFEHRSGQRLHIFAGLVRHGGAGVGLYRRLVIAGAIHVGGDAQAVEQRGIIKIAAARPGKGNGAHRVEPDFGGMGSELIGIVRIAGGIGDDHNDSAHEDDEEEGSAALDL